MARAQQYDLVLRGGRVIDPGNGIDGRMDVAVSNGRTAAVQPDIPAVVGEPYESDTEDMDPARTADTISKNRDVIVGIQTAHFAKPGWTAIDRAVEAGRKAGVPVMVDDKIFTNSGRTTREELLDHLRPGDIHTHMCVQLRSGTTLPSGEATVVMKSSESRQDDQWRPGLKRQ